MEKELANQERYIQQAEVLKLTSLSSNTIRSLEKRGKFPKRRELSARAVRWWLPEVVAWLKDPTGWSATAWGGGAIVLGGKVVGWG